jgi:hypothetical protein
MYRSRLTTRELVLRLFIIVGMLLALLVSAAMGTVGAGASPREWAAASGVSVYKGVERTGLERRACSFKDGSVVQRGEVSSQRIIVTSASNREYYRSDPVPELQNYAVQSLDCARSSNTGTLVVTIGGFYAGSNTSQSLMVNTPYFIRDEVTYEQVQLTPTAGP